MANGDPNKKKTVDEFALSIKEKYPQYKDVDNLTLAKKMVEKYPIYADKVDLGSQGVEPAGKQKAPTSGVSPSASVSGDSSLGLSRSELYNTFQQKREEAESLYKRIEAFKENNTLPALEESQEYIDYLNKKTQLDKLKPTLEEVNSSLEKYKEYFNEDQQTYIFPNEQLMADAQQDFNAAQNLYEQEQRLVSEINEMANAVNSLRDEYNYDEYNDLVKRYNKAFAEKEDIRKKIKSISPEFKGEPMGVKSLYDKRTQEFRDKERQAFYEKALSKLPSEQPTFGDYVSATWNSVLEGMSGFSYNLLKSSGLRDEQDLASWLEENKNSYPEFYQSYQKRKEPGNPWPAMLAFWDLPPNKMREIGDSFETYQKEREKEAWRETFGLPIDPKKEEKIRETFLGGALTGLGASVPAMVASRPTMGMSFFDMAYQGADENLKQIKREKGVEMSPLDEETYKLTIGATNLILERVGLRNVLKGTPMSKSLANYFSSKAYNRLAKEAAESGGKISKESFDRVVNEEASAFLKYAKGVANGTISEFETGTLQSLAEDFTEQGINIIQGREIFDSKTVGEITGDAIYSGAQEAVGGGIISSTIGIFATDNPSKEDKVRFMKLIESTDDVEGLKKELKLQIAKNRIDKDQSQRLLDKIDEYSQIIESLPEDLTTEAKVEAVELLQKKKKLETKLAKLDDAFKEPVKKQIEEINNSLRNLEGKTTQVTKTEEDAVQERETIPDEISSLKDDEVKVFTVENIEDIPEQFRDRAEKKEGMTVKVRKKILGIPIGKETERTIGEGYSYTLTGKEIKDYAVQERETKEVPVGEEAQVGEEMVGEVREQAEEVQGQEEVRQREDAVISAIDSNEALNKIDNNEPLNIEEANKAQEELLALIDDLDPARDAELIELIEDEFQRIEDYDNKTETVTETTTEKRPVGSPKRVAKIKERKASEKVENLIENSQVLTGSETENEISVLETDDDGNVVIRRYNKKSGQKSDIEDLNTGVKPSEIEYVGSNFDEDGNLESVTMRVKSPLGDNESPVEFTVVKRNDGDERPLDIAIASAKEQIGDIPEIEFQQAYETVTKTETVEEPIKPKDDAIQEQETDEVDVRQQTEDGKTVGEEVRSTKEPTKNKKEELKSRIKDRLKGNKIGFAYDPKRQAKEDLDFFKDVVELASIYIQEGVKSAEVFAKKAGIELNRLTREAYNQAKKGRSIYDEDNIWELMSAIIPKKKKKSVEASRKAVQKKHKKGDYTNVQQEVSSFIELPLHKVSDATLLDDIETTLKDARRGKVNPKKIKSLTEQVEQNLNAQQLSQDPNDFTQDRLSERLDNIGGKKEKKGKRVPNRIEAITESDFTKESLKDSRSRFSRLINDLRFLENVNNILFELKQLTQDQFQENQKAIADARAKLNEKAKNADANIQEALKELNKENENKAKVYRPQDVTDDPILENEVRNFFEAIEDYDADDISLALEVADIFDDLEVGYIPVGKMAEIANTITATVAANSEGMQKAKDNIASMPKEKSGFIARAFEMFNPVRKASVDFQEWVKRFRNQEFWSWENILGVNKESPIYKLLNDVVTQGEAYSESVATEMAALYKALKFPVLRKGIAGKERLEGAYKQFMKDLSSPENREKRVMVGMIMIERRFRELYDKPFWNNVMSDKDKTNRLSGKKDKLLGGVSEIEIYEKAYAKLPKNEDGTIDLEAAFKQVRKDRISNSLINFLEEKFDENGELAQKQKVSNQKRGLPTDFGRFYFPFLKKGGISQETKEFDFNDFFSAVNPKIASDRGKEIKDSSYSMMEADPLSVFSDYIHQVNRDYHLTDAIRTAYKFFNQAIKDSEGEAKTVFSAMKDALKANVAWAFQAPDSTITDKLLQASYAYYLTTMYRAVAEPTSEMIRSIGAGEINTKMLKYAYDEGMSSIKDMFAKVKGLRLNENGEIETTGEFRSNFKKLLDFSNSPFRRQFSRQFADGSIRTSAKRDAGLFEKTSNMIMGFPNRASLFLLWMPAFDNRYKEITGKDFDYTKIDDENYLKDNRKDIRDAAAYADKNTARYKGYSTALGGRTMNKAFALPFIPGWWNKNIDALKDPGLFKMNQFLGSFGWRDSFNIAEGVRDIALSLGDNMTSEDLKKYMTDNPTTALRTITALIASGISYPIIRRMMAYLDAKDEDEEDLPQWKKDMVKDVEENGFFTIDGMIQESLGYATFLATSKYGYSSRFGTLTLLGIIQNQLLNQKKFATKEEEKKIDAAIDRINETSKAFLFSEPINLTGSGQWGAATPAKDVIEMIPGFGLPMQFGIQLERSINTVIKAEERGTDEQQKAAYILAANDLIKTALLFGGGTVLPAGKEIDIIATGKKIKLSEELTEKEGGSLDLKNLKPSLPEMPSIF